MQISRSWKAQTNQDKQPGRPSHVGQPTPLDIRIWKKFPKSGSTITKMKVIFTEKKVLYFKESIIVSIAYSRKCYIKQKFLFI